VKWVVYPHLVPNDKTDKCFVHDSVDSDVQIIVSRYTVVC